MTTGSGPGGRPDRVIRPAGPDDVDAVLGMIRELAAYERAADAVQASSEDLRAALFAERPQVFCHLAEDGGEPVGFALWFVSFSTWTGRHGVYLEDLYVRAEARGRGHGKALLADLAAICVEQGYSRLEWSVLDWNADALAFYASLEATQMSEWTVQRLQGAQLRSLAATAGVGRDDGSTR